MNIVELEGGEILVVKEQPSAVAKVAGRMVAEVSNENIDSSGDIIMQGRTKKGAGWLLDSFNANPILTWSHDRFTIPSIGSADVRAKVAKVEGGGRALLLDPFAFDMPDPFAASIAGKYERGVLKHTSVGFTSKVWEPLGSEGGRQYFEQKLLEVAAVNIGDNPTTNVMVKMLGSHGLIAKVESAGDSEVEELKELIAALKDEQITMRQEIRALSNVVKMFGDQEDSSGRDAAAVVSAAAQSTGSEIDLAATAILLRLKALGLAQ